MASHTVSAIVLAAKGEVKKAKLKLNEYSELTLEGIQSYFKKKSEPEQLGYYEYDTYLIFLLGYKEGKAGTENKHELPPPYESLVAFGDLLVVASHDREWQKPCSFSPEQYQKFYDTLMGGGYDSAAEGEDAGAEDDAATDAMSESDLDDDAADADEDVVDEEGAVVEEPEEEADEPPPQKVKKSSAKKVVASSGYQKQQTLISQTNFAELTADAAAGQVQQRRKAVTRFSFLEVQGDATAADLVAFEQEIYRAACTQADRLKVVKHWDNTLFADIYVNIQRGLLANLHTASPIKNGRLLTRLRDGELKLTELPAMSSYELYPENWKELADRQMLREQKLLEGNKGAATDRFKCNRCGKRECSYYEMQTRSADEPMTIFISCLNCGKRWRQ